MVYFDPQTENPPMEHLTLHSGDKMPQVGFGLWQLPKEKTAQIAYDAIKSGYRLIDEASDYGNEKECGQGISKAIEDKIVTREDLWITSKLWNTHHSKDHVKMACKKSI